MNPPLHPRRMMGATDRTDRPPGLADDPDDEWYRRWRDECAQRLDEDYRAWCEERYQRFCAEFGRWRTSRGRQHLHYAADEDATPHETPSLSIGP